MLTHYNDIADVVSPDDSYIDGFISTDFQEFDDYLNPLGFFEASKTLKVPELSLENEVDWLSLVLSNKRTGLVIECADIPIPDSMQAAKNLKADLGFIPMSRFRVHAKPTNGVVRDL